jgi:hypothetical protein
VASRGFLSDPRTPTRDTAAHVAAIYADIRGRQNVFDRIFADYSQKVQSRAGVRLAIEDTLDEGLPRPYSKELYETKCNVLFEHVYESYIGDGKSVYADAA